MLNAFRPEALRIGGGSALSIPTGVLYVCSRDPRALRVDTGAKLTARSVGVAGGVFTGGDAQVQVGERIPVPVPADPMDLPEPDVAHLQVLPDVDVRSSDRITLSPGVYNSIKVAASARATLSPGVYVVNGPLEVTASGVMAGADVVLVSRGTVAVTSSGTLSLSAPSVGPYAGSPSSSRAPTARGFRWTTRGR